jgi:hypothetical protein
VCEIWMAAHEWLAIDRICTLSWLSREQNCASPVKPNLSDCACTILFRVKYFAFPRKSLLECFWLRIQNSYELVRIISYWSSVTTWGNISSYSWYKRTIAAKSRNAHLPINILYLNCNCCSQFACHHAIAQITVSHFVSDSLLFFAFISWKIAPPSKSIPEITI